MKRGLALVSALVPLGAALCAGPALNPDARPQTPTRLCNRDGLLAVGAHQGGGSGGEG
jgi:hypothetical protein